MANDDEPTRKATNHLSSVAIGGGAKGFSAEQRAAFEALRSNPKIAEMLARQRRVSQREPLAFAIVERSLQSGVVAVVRIGQPAPLPRYAVVSATAFDDTVYLAALGRAFAYEMSHEDDDSPVTMTIHSDDTVDYDSGKYGKYTASAKSEGSTADPHRRSGPMLRARTVVALQDIPGFGLARVARPVDDRIR